MGYNTRTLCTALHPPTGVRDLQYKLSRRCPRRGHGAGPPRRQQMKATASVGQLYVPQVPFSILFGTWELPFSNKVHTRAITPPGPLPRSQQEVFLYGNPTQNRPHQQGIGHPQTVAGQRHWQRGPFRLQAVCRNHRPFQRHDFRCHPLLLGCAHNTDRLDRCEGVQKGIR